MTTVRTALGLILVIGCSSNVERSATADAPPPDVAFVAAFATNEANEVVAGSLLSRRGSPVGALLPDDWANGTRGWVVGYTDEAMATVAENFVPDVGPVRMAKDGDLVLPMPSWSLAGPIEEGAATLTEVRADVPELTVDGLPACTRLLSEPTSLIDTRCRLRPCNPLARQVDCRLELDLTDCELPEFKGEVDGAGAFSSDDCRDLDEPDGVDLRLECTDGEVSCTVLVYAEAAPVKAEVIRHSLDVPFTNLSRDGYDVLGYTGGLARVADRLIVVEYDRRTMSPSCGTTTPSFLLHFDPTTLDVVDRVETVDCVREVVAHPNGTSLLALVGGPSGAALMNLGVNGVVIGEGLVVAASEPTEFGQLVVHGDGAYVSWLELTALGLVARIHTASVADLTLLSSSDCRPELRALTDAYHDGNLLLVNEDDELLEFYDFTKPTERGKIFDLGPCLSKFDPRRILTLPDGQAFAVGEENQSALAHLDLQDSELNCRASSPFLEPTDLRQPVGPLSNGDIVVAGRNYDPIVTDEQRAAFFSIYRPSRSGFLPAKIEIGRGPPDGVIAEGDVVFALLPWAGEVVRVQFDVAP